MKNMEEAQRYDSRCPFADRLSDRHHWEIEGTPRSKMTYYVCSQCHARVERGVGSFYEEPKKGPSRRQIVYNWMMGEPDFATKLDGWWGTSEELAKVDALLVALSRTF